MQNARHGDALARGMPRHLVKRLEEAEEDVQLLIYYVRYPLYTDTTIQRETAIVSFTLKIFKKTSTKNLYQHKTQGRVL
jgi:hypothetical protein